MKNPALESSAIHGCKYNTANFLREYPPKECQKDHFLIYAVMFCLPRHFDHSMSFFKVFLHFGMVLMILRT